jgi:alpha-galactosidase
MPRLEEIAQERLARLPDLDSTAEIPDAQDLPLEEIQPFSWHLLQLLGAFPAPLDRHVTEFFPQFFRHGRYYGRTLGVDAYSFERTIARGDQIYAEMRAEALSREPLPESYFAQMSGEHEQVVEIIHSVRRDAGRVYSVNLPNQGQVPNLPEDAIVEGPAVVNGGGIKPIAQPPLPPAIVGTLATRMAWVETVVEAALEGSRKKFVQALVLDGAVPSLQVAEQLADDLLAAQAPYLNIE